MYIIKQNDRSNPEKEAFDMPQKSANHAELPTYVIDALARAFLSALQASHDTSFLKKGEPSS